MSGHLLVSKQALPAFLCCLVPLAALAAVFYFRIPTVLVALVAFILLIPLARWLLRSAWDGKH